MNKTQQIVGSMSQAQKEEFEKDLKQISEVMSKQYDGNPQTVAEANVNMRLPGELYLNVTVLFHRDELGTLSAIVQHIHQFHSIDEYLDAINEAKTPGGGYTKLK